LTIPFLSELLGYPLIKQTRGSNKSALAAVLGWGKKPSTRKIRAFAKKNRIDYWALEDGFLRSYGTGNHFPPLSLVVDRIGIYYDCTAPSELELLLQSSANLIDNYREDTLKAISLIQQFKLSKYNHAPDFDSRCLQNNIRVLVVDQTVGDISVSLGGANKKTFLLMLAAARRENPTATIYIKTHPEVSSKLKKGYLSWVKQDNKTIILDQLINPLGLLDHMDKVYVVTSQLGFEALLLNKPVIVFGMPWYAGWGVTEDRIHCSRRTNRRTVNELFAAAYLDYTHYLNPYTHKKGTILDVIDWLIGQKNQIQHIDIIGKESLYAIGFSIWKQKNIRALLSLNLNAIEYKSHRKPRRDSSSGGIALLLWGGFPPAWIKKSNKSIWKVEDGFIRSVGLGSKGVRPLSLVIDKQGIYFDPNNPSDLELLLNSSHFDPLLLETARKIRNLIVTHKITKYNLEHLSVVDWDKQEQVKILIPGQVDDDASVLLGCSEVRSNLELIKVVRLNNPQAFLIYKPHPDVMSGNRKGLVSLKTIRMYVDYIELNTSIIDCIEAADEIHTMTSLSGFDALLRKKKVTTYGEPFYAGWGLTDDKINISKSFNRRQRRLTLDELVAGTLLMYPLYYDWDLNGYTTCESVLAMIVEQRDSYLGKTINKSNMYRKLLSYLS
jgi:capsular polysaccharide export protein